MNKDECHITYGTMGKVNHWERYRYALFQNSYVLFADRLKHNLLSISQLCDKENKVIFESGIFRFKATKILIVANMSENIYPVNFDDLNEQNVKCFLALEKDSWLWHLGKQIWNFYISYLNENLLLAYPK